MAEITVLELKNGRLFGKQCHRITRLIAALVMVLVGLPHGQIVLAATPDRGWPISGGEHSGHYWSSLAQINESNVETLGPAWSFDLDTTRGQESEPIVVDGVMYVTSAWSKVFALDALTGRLLWKFDPKVPGVAGVGACCDVVNRGAAVSGGKVYVGTIDARLIALDAKTGKVIWSTNTAENGRTYSITGVPLVVKNKVIIGNGGADFDARGYVTAYDAITGAKVWRFYIVPGEPGKSDGDVSDDVLERVARPTWFGDKYWQYGGGGTAWNALSYDAELNRLYIGTGNGAPWNQKFRSEGKGDNLFLCSIIALDPASGKYIWHYQENPGESWDYNSTQPMIVTDVMVEGVQRQVILHAPKNGFFYVIDRRNGKLISAEPFVAGITWTTGIDKASGRPVDIPAARYTIEAFKMTPGAGGAHSWYPMALSPSTGLVYLPTEDNSFLYRSAEAATQLKGVSNNEGLDYFPRKGDPMPSLGGARHLVAWDPSKQKEVWSVPGGVGGVLATAGGLLFQGGGDITGEIVAHRATDGATLWRHHLPNGVIAVPVTYTVKGEQYVAVTSGAGARWLLAAPKAYAKQVGRVVAFKLGGKAALAPDPGPPPPLNPSTTKWSDTAVTAGAQLYLMNCLRCHGVPAMASNIIPDLRRSVFLGNATAWNKVVLEGALASNGMIGWAQFLSEKNAQDIRAFVDTEAQQAVRGESSVRAVGPAQ